MIAAVRRLPQGILSVYPALGYRNYLLYWVGFVVSTLGMWMQNLAQSWLILELTESPIMLGLVGAFWTIPNVLLTLFGGVVADKVNRKHLLLVTRSLGGLISFVTALLISTEQVQVWHIFAMSAALGVVFAFDMPTTQAFVPTLVKPVHLTSAIALNSAAFNGTRIIGPSVAGIVVARLGIAPCFYLAVVASAVMVASIALLKVSDRRIPVGQGLWRDIQVGVAYLRADSILLVLLGMMLLNALFGMVYPPMVPVFVREVLQEGSEEFGLLMAGAGVGALAGTLIVASFGDRTRKGLISAAGAICLGLSLVALALSNTLESSLGAMVAIGFANAGYTTLVMTAVQSRLDDAFRGRVMSVFGMIMSLMPLAGLQAGAIASVYGVQAAIGVNGLLVFCTALAILALLPQLRRV